MLRFAMHWWDGGIEAGQEGKDDGIIISVPYLKCGSYNSFVAGYSESDGRSVFHISLRRSCHIGNSIYTSSNGDRRERAALEYRRHCTRPVEAGYTVHGRATV